MIARLTVGVDLSTSVATPIRVVIVVGMSPETYESLSAAIVAADLERLRL